MRQDLYFLQQQMIFTSNRHPQFVILNDPLCSQALVSLRGSMMRVADRRALGVMVYNYWHRILFELRRDQTANSEFSFYEIAQIFLTQYSMLREHLAGNEKCARLASQFYSIWIDSNLSNLPTKDAVNFLYEFWKQELIEASYLRTRNLQIKVNQKLSDLLFDLVKHKLVTSKIDFLFEQMIVVTGNFVRCGMSTACFSTEALTSLLTDVPKRDWMKSPDNVDFRAEFFDAVRSLHAAGLDVRLPYITPPQVGRPILRNFDASRSVVKPGISYAQVAGGTEATSLPSPEGSLRAFARSW